MNTSTTIPDTTNSADARETHTIRLDGCAPTPMAHYLKALATLRIVAEQADPEARGWWQNDSFFLSSKLNHDELLDFFTQDYIPTPIASPWNGGSGMKVSEVKDDVVAIRDSAAPRLDPYRRVITTTFELLRALNIEGKPSKDEKDIFLEACRGTFPSEALPWLDAAFVLTPSTPKYPSILGSGGNDGRLDFGINFMARIADICDLESGDPTRQSRPWLEASLLDRAQSELTIDVAIGQFFPQAVGGTNQTAGFDAKTICNPWDFILMLEGAVLFASAAVKRLESARGAQASVPFSVRHVGIGHGSADASEEAGARNELWVPVWNAPTSLRELNALMSEGRARIGRRNARNSVEFARAVATLGVDRGIGSFQRYGFQERNGRAFFATPLNRITVVRRPNVDLIEEIDSWLNTFFAKAFADNAPSAVASAGRNLQEAIFRLCQTGDRGRVLDVLICLGACERALAQRTTWTFGQHGLRPLAGLSARWVREAYDGSVEFRLAATLASTYGHYGERGSSVSLRTQLEPIRYWGSKSIGWNEEAGREVVWHDGDPVDALNRVMHRRILGATQGDLSMWSDRSTIAASLGDIAAFVDGRVDIRRLATLLWGLITVDWVKVDRKEFDFSADALELAPSALYAMTKLCFPGFEIGHGDAKTDIPIVPAIHRHLTNGDGSRASRCASRRLRGSGLVPALQQIPIDGDSVRRSGAALLFPIRRSDLRRLMKLVLRPPKN